MDTRKGTSEVGGNGHHVREEEDLELLGSQSSNAWGGKFKFGLLSSFFSSYLLGGESRWLIKALAAAEPSNEDISNLAAGVSKLNARFQSASDKDLIAAYTNATSGSTFGCLTHNIFDVRRSFASLTLNANFVSKMKDHPELADVDDILRLDRAKFIEYFQYNAHRGAYNEGLSVPRNSVASVVNAYVSGIRSVEFDVLETAGEGKQPYTNVVIHDTNANRLNGGYNDPPITISKWPYEELTSLPIGILNPMASSPELFPTNISGLMTTRDFLRTALSVTKGMTFYADARNYAPVSLFRMLAAGKIEPQLDAPNHLVTKIYPFLLNGGAFDLVSTYAERYCDGQFLTAAAELAQLKPNVLLAIGGVDKEAGERVFRANAEQFGACQFDWTAFQKACTRLPYSLKNIEGPENQLPGAAAGQHIFAEKALQQIEASTFVALRWIFDFYAFADVRVIQVAMLPSLAKIALNRDATEYREMTENTSTGPSYLHTTSVTDNIVAFFNLLQAEKDPLDDVTIFFRGEPIGSLKSLAKTTGWGSSDRYPDFGVCNWDSSSHLPHGNVDTDIKQYYYGMPATAGMNDSYAQKKMRDSVSIQAKIAEFSGSGMHLKFCYLTTDLPEDLRCKPMTVALPPIKLRLGGMIAESQIRQYKSFQPKTYVLPSWSASLFGAASAISPAEFETQKSAFAKLNSDKMERERALGALQAFQASPGTVLVYPPAVARLDPNAPYLASIPDIAVFNAAVDNLQKEIDGLTASMIVAAETFRSVFGVPIDGSTWRKNWANIVPTLEPEYPEWY